MIYSFDLRFVGFVVGIALMVAHILAILHAKEAQAFLKRFPRSVISGRVLLSLAGIWSFWLVATMDLGEFTSYRNLLMIGVPVAWFLCLNFVDDFLSVRALGMLLLLLAEPVLESAFLRPEGSRLLLVVLAYAWIVAGMFWVGMPYLLRDAISWLLKSNSRWWAACLGGAVYGAAITICAFFFYGRY